MSNVDRLLQVYVSYRVREGFEIPDYEDSLPQASDSKRTIKQLLLSFAKFCPFNREIAKKAKPCKVLAICDQNQGRSQLAEWMLEVLFKALDLPVTAASAGVNAEPERYGGKPGPRVVNKLRRLGFAKNNATVDKYKAEDVDADTIVLALCQKSHLPESVFKAMLVIGWPIEDKFPGNVVPKKEGLNDIVDSVLTISLRLALKLAEAMGNNDFSIFTKEFKDNILTGPRLNRSNSRTTVFQFGDLGISASRNLFSISPIKE